VTLKLLFLLALFFLTAPVVTHALAQACLHENIRPMLTEDRRSRGVSPNAGKSDGRQP
jgi:multicomponent Na+:H+ antiporter subunit G